MSSLASRKSVTKPAPKKTVWKKGTTAKPSLGASLSRSTALMLATWIILPTFFFVAAGDWGWWQAWVYCFIILIPMTVFGTWAARRSPELVQRRLETHETVPAQRRIMTVVKGAAAVLYVVPVLEHRDLLPFNDAVTVWQSCLGLALVLIGYLGVLGVMASNPWAGRTVRTWTGQQIVTTGPYAVVRHPMYSAFVLFIVATPWALGSNWALLPALVLLPMLVLRIRSEEAELHKAFSQYATYCAKVHYRLVPGIW